MLRFLSGFLLLQLSEMTCRGIETLFKRDRKGEATLETVRTISQMIKANSYKSRPQVLSHTITLFLSFLFFPLFCCPSSLLILFSIYLLLCPGSKDISCTQLDRTIGRRNWHHQSHETSKRSKIHFKENEKKEQRRKEIGTRLEKSWSWRKSWRTETNCMILLNNLLSCFLRTVWNDFSHCLIVLKFLSATWNFDNSVFDVLSNT